MHLSDATFIFAYIHKLYFKEGERVFSVSPSNLPVDIDATL